MPLAPTERSWVPVYRKGQAAVPHQQAPLPAYDEVNARDPELPAYDEVMGQGAVRRLPASRAVPVNVVNESPAWRTRSATAPAHPEVQTRELQKLMDQRARTQRKLDTSLDHLEKLQLDHALRPGSFRNVCGAGLFDDAPCVAEKLAQREVEHYRKKKQTLLGKHVALLNRSTEQPSPRDSGAPNAASRAGNPSPGLMAWFCRVAALRSQSDQPGANHSRGTR